MPNNESNVCPTGNNLSVSCDATNTSSLTIQLSDISGELFKVQCNRNDSENRLIYATIDNMLITYTPNNTGDGTSCTILFGAELLSRNESSLFSVSCLNTDIGVQTNETFEIPGKYANEYKMHVFSYACNSCKTLIEVREMHGKKAPQLTILLAHDPFHH